MCTQSDKTLSICIRQRERERDREGDDSVSLRRIWTKLGENYSYKPPGACYTPQGPQKQPEFIKNQLVRN